MLLSSLLVYFAFSTFLFWIRPVVSFKRLSLIGLLLYAPVLISFRILTKADKLLFKDK